MSRSQCSDIHLHIHIAQAERGRSLMTDMIRPTMIERPARTDSRLFETQIHVPEVRPCLIVVVAEANFDDASRGLISIEVKCAEELPSNRAEVDIRSVDINGNYVSIISWESIRAI